MNRSRQPKASFSSSFVKARRPFIVKRLGSLALLFLGARAIAYAPPTNSSTQPSPITTKSIEQLNLELEVLNLPTRWRWFNSTDDVFRISRANGMLSAKLVAPNIPEPTRIFIKGVPGVLFVKPLGIGTPDEAEAWFDFEQIDHTTSADKEIRVSVSFTAGQLNISCFAEDTDDRQFNVQFIQSADAGADPEAMPVHLFITSKNWPGKENLVIKYDARTFDELCTQHPREIAEYLRPIFVDLQQSSENFGPNPRIAWQIFAAEAPIDPAVQKRVEQLLTKLDADDFHVRNTAQNDLESLGQPAALVLMRADQSSMSADKRSSIDTLLAPYLMLDAHALKELRDNRFFLLDCLSVDDQTLRELAWKRLAELTSTKLAFDPAANANARAGMVQKLRDALQTSATRPSPP